MDTKKTKASPPRQALDLNGLSSKAVCDYELKTRGFIISGWEAGAELDSGNKASPGVGQAGEESCASG